MLKSIRRFTNDLAVKRKRLLYKSQKRGIVENNLLLTTFAEQKLDTLSNSELDDYSAFLDENDWDIFYWLVGRKQIPEEYANLTITKLLLAHVNSRRPIKSPVPTK